jgi:pimeloyl-ACP methyl ester carboxylesterase
MSDPPATIVLVHGAWHGSWTWERVVPLLEGRGLAVRTVDLPSIGAAPDSGACLEGDAAAVRAVLDEVDGPVLLCGHSYGGMVISQAAAGHPAVARLVYLCAFMPEAGESLNGITGGPPPWIVALDDGRMLSDLTKAPDTFYADCDSETCERAVARLRPMPVAPFEDPVHSPAWKELPSTYVVCTQDQAIPPELQQEVFAPRADEVLVLKKSHSPFFSAPTVVAELLAERVV